MIYKSPVTFSNDYSAALKMCDDHPVPMLNFKYMGPDEGEYENAKGDKHSLFRNIETIFEGILADQTRQLFQHLAAGISKQSLRHSPIVSRPTSMTRNTGKLRRG